MQSKIRKTFREEVLDPCWLTLSDDRFAVMICTSQTELSIYAKITERDDLTFVDENEDWGPNAPQGLGWG